MISHHFYEVTEAIWYTNNFIDMFKLLLFLFFWVIDKNRNDFILYLPLLSQPLL